MTITYPEFQRLKKLYAVAVAEGQEIFVFKGQELLTAYAKYLIEYLEGRMK